MKIGLIARANQRGLGIQTHEAYLHMKPTKTLVVLLPEPQFPDDVGRFDGPNTEFIDTDHRRHLNEGRVRRFLEGLDVVFSVETLYEWEMARWAKEMGVRTVIQGNPEFFVHHQQPQLAPPDVWTWPTDWLLEFLPTGLVLPVPVPESTPVQAGDPEDETLRILHVAGHAAAGDRNGTLDFMESLRHIETRVHVTVVSQDGWLPDAHPGRRVTLELLENGVEDRWSMYENQHLVVLPRRYGGLCLPAQEALTVGCAVLMPDTCPNRTWPIVPMETRLGRLHRAPFGVFPTVMVRGSVIAATIDELARDRVRLAQVMMGSQSWAASNTWETWLPAYHTVLAGAAM